MKRTISFFLLVSLIISTLSGTVIVYASGSQNEPAENTIGMFPNQSISRCQSPLLQATVIRRVL